MTLKQKKYIYIFCRCFNYQGYHPEKKSQHQRNEAKYIQIYSLHHFSWRLPVGIVLKILTWSLNSTLGFKKKKKKTSYLPPRESVALMPHIIANCFFYGMHNLDGQNMALRGRREKVNEVPGMSFWSNEAWTENIPLTSSDWDGSRNSFIEVSALIHQSITHKEK